jgi:hypothetical protein
VQRLEDKALPERKQLKESSDNLTEFVESWELEELTYGDGANMVEAEWARLYTAYTDFRDVSPSSNEGHVDKIERNKRNHKLVKEYKRKQKEVNDIYAQDK